MPATFELTWNKKQRRWFKKYKGKQYTFYFGPDSTKENSYSKAFEAWEKKKKEIDSTEPPAESAEVRAWKAISMASAKRQLAGEIEPLEFFRQRHAENGDEAAASLAIGEIDKRRKLIEDRTTNCSSVQGTLVEACFSPAVQQPEVGATIGPNAGQFLERKRATVSTARANGYRICMDRLTEFLGSTEPLTKIDAASLEGFHNHVLGMVKNGEIADSTGRDWIDTAKQFVRWLWERTLIELPRNLDKLTIRKRTRVVETIPDAEIRRLIEGAHGTTKLYLLLALNCGFTQSDIAKLRQDEVNWKAGRIKRKRSKTADHDDVPVVNYPLWRVTAKLLREFRSDDKELVLLNADGKPLLHDGMNDEGKYFKNDNIKSAYSRLLKRIGGDYPFKLLRKTAASKLGEHAEYARFAQYFLGHSPATIADKHYVKPSEEQFSEAVQWLGKQFGVE